jgi:hypothetical protein
VRRALLVCLVLAGLSLLGPSVPTYDPWSWIVWGREVVALDLQTTNGPSWKPLPVLFTAPFSLFGDAAPLLWLWVARAGWLAALVLAYRLGARLAGPLAGGVAAALLLLVPDWLRYAAHGNAEGLVAALALGAVEAHLAGRRGAALGLAYLLALARPEAWPFLGGYGLVLCVREPRRRLLLAALALLLPLLWLGPDVWGAGDPLQGTSRARHMTPEEVGPRGARLLEVVGGALALVLAPALAAALAALALCPPGSRRTVLALAGMALGWIALVAGMALAGFAGFARFAVPAAAILCVLGGAGTAWLARGRAGRAMAAVLAFVAAPGVAAASSELLDQARDVRSRAALQRDLRAVVAQAGGAAALGGCRRPAVNEELQTALAWHLGRHLAGVNVRPRPADLVLRAPPSELAGELPRTTALPAGAAPVISAGRWDLLINPGVTPRRHCGSRGTGRPRAA